MKMLRMLVGYNDNSNGFILFIDCDDLIKRKNRAKTEIIDIAEMLKSDLKNKPVLNVFEVRKLHLKGEVCIQLYKIY